MPAFRQLCRTCYLYRSRRPPLYALCFRNLRYGGWVILTFAEVVSRVKMWTDEKGVCCLYPSHDSSLDGLWIFGNMGVYGSNWSGFADS